MKGMSISLCHQTTVSEWPKSDQENYKRTKNQHSNRWKPIKLGWTQLMFMPMWVWVCVKKTIRSQVADDDGFAYKRIRCHEKRKRWLEKKYACAASKRKGRPRLEDWPAVPDVMSAAEPTNPPIDRILTTHWRWWQWNSLCHPFCWLLWDLGTQPMWTYIATRLWRRYAASGRAANGMKRWKKRRS